MTTQLLIEQLRAHAKAPDIHDLCERAADRLEILSEELRNHAAQIDDLYDRIQDLQDE